MNRIEFKKMYDSFNANSEIGYFNDNDWDKSVSQWEPFYKEIVSVNGLELGRWVKNSAGYLPDFLDTKEQKFGHARIGNYDQVMIYQFTGGNDASRKNK